MRTIAVIEEELFYVTRSQTQLPMGTGQTFGPFLSLGDARDCIVEIAPSFAEHRYIVSCVFRMTSYEPEAIVCVPGPGAGDVATFSLRDSGGAS